MTRLIDAEPLEEEFYKQANARLCGYSEFMEGVKNGYRLALMHIKNVPTVEERQHGEWIDRSEGRRVRYPFWNAFECSNCGWAAEITNYCPNCGADMRPKEG